MVEARADDQRGIIDYVSRIIWRMPPDKRFAAIGSYQDGELIGGFLYTDYKPIADGQFSVEMHMGGQPGWLTRSTLRAFFRYPFHSLHCARVIGPVQRDNWRSADISRRLGCKLDGIVRSGIRPELDTMVWTMTRAECPWIR